MHADIGQVPVSRGGQQFGDAVDEGLAAEKSDVRVGGRLRYQMLASAKADFKPHLVHRTAEQIREVAGGCVEVKLKRLQRCCKYLLLARAQRMALAPAEEGAVGWVGHTISNHGSR